MWVDMLAFVRSQYQVGNEWGSFLIIEERYLLVGGLGEYVDSELVEGGVAGGEEFEVFEVN